MLVIQRMIKLAGVSVALFVFVFYAIVMTPDTAMATSWPDGSYELEKVFFVYEDHIGRPVLVSEYKDEYDEGYFNAWSGKPIWQAVYKPFGQVHNKFESTGIKIGDPAENGLWWDIPFRFPGQYADKEWNDDVYYNWHRYYIPHTGRYNRADPLGITGDDIYSYALNNPGSLIDPAGLKWCHKDFVAHYYSRTGAPVDLANVGLLPAFATAPSVTASTDSFKNLVRMSCVSKANSLCDGCDNGRKSDRFQLHDTDTTDVTFEPCLYSVGKSTFFRDAGCVISADCGLGRYKYACEFDFSIQDKFEDPVNLGIETGGIPYRINASFKDGIMGSGEF